jgi:hypothetical protein
MALKVRGMWSVCADEANVPRRAFKGLMKRLRDHELFTTRARPVQGSTGESGIRQRTSVPPRLRRMMLKWPPIKPMR